MDEIALIMDGIKSQPKQDKKDKNKEGLDALRMSAHKFYSDSKPQSANYKKSNSKSMKNLMGQKSSSNFKFSEENFRKSFFNDLQGPNSNRFIVFNDISDTNSKYIPLSKPDFGKLINRSKPIIGTQN